MDASEMELIHRWIDEAVAGLETRIGLLDYGNLSEQMRSVAQDEIQAHMSAMSASAEAERTEADRIAAELAAVESAAAEAAEAAAEAAESAEEAAEAVEEAAKESEGESEDEHNEEIAEAVEDANAEGEPLPEEVTAILNEESGEPQAPNRTGFWNGPLLRR